MKYISVIIIALLLPFIMQAQIKPEAGSFGLGFSITGLADVALYNQKTSGLSGAQLSDPFGILLFPSVSALFSQSLLYGKYYIQDDVALRIGFGVNTTKNTTTSADSVFF